MSVLKSCNSYLCLSLLFPSLSVPSLCLNESKSHFVVPPGILFIINRNHHHIGSRRNVLLSLDGGHSILRLQNPPPVPQPVHSDVPEHVQEPNERHNVRDPRPRRVCNRPLNGREDCTTADAHNQNASTAPGVRAEVGGPEGKDGRVHGRLEEEDDDQHNDGHGAPADAHKDCQPDGKNSVHHEQKVRLQHRRQGRGDEASHREGDERVRQHLGRLGVGEVRVFGRVVNEEGRDRHLRADVADLGHKGGYHVVLPVQGAGGSLGGRLVVLGRGGLAHLGELGEEEEQRDGGAGAGDAEVDKLHRGEVVRAAAEEELAGDEGADEAGDAVPALAELEARAGGGRVPDDDGIAVGRRLQRGEAAGDDKGAGAKAAKGGAARFRGREVGGGPEEDGAEGVEREAEQDGQLVAAALEDLGRDGGEEEVATTKVHDLQTRGLETGDAKDGLEVLVKDCSSALVQSLRPI